VWVAAAGCDRPSHDKIEEWVGTQKGPSKIRAVLESADHDADLRAHAAHALAIRLRQDSQVIDLLGQVPDGQRQPILAALAPRLWEDARVVDQMARPSERQMLAKDVLYFLRPLADAANLQVIDGYLVDWLTGGYYEGRADSGRVRGEVIMSQVSNKADAATKLIQAVNSEVAQTNKLGDNLLYGLAATGTEQAVAKLLDLAESEIKDDTLERRAMVHLYNAFVEPEDFAPAAPAALVPAVPRLAAIMLDEGKEDEVVDIAINLVTRAGMPACRAPLLEMVSHPHSNPRFRWIGVKRALKCGGLDIAAAVIDTLTPKGGYRQIDLDDALWTPLAAMEPRAKVAELGRTLLTSDSWVARISGVELLGKLAQADSAAGDSARVAALGADKTPLKDWWGDQSELPKKERKPTPTLGERAREVAGQLEELAKSSQK
jgi:hypothetical protein